MQIREIIDGKDNYKLFWGNTETLENLREINYVSEDFLSFNIKKYKEEIFLAESYNNIIAGPHGFKPIDKSAFVIILHAPEELSEIPKVYRFIDGHQEMEKPVGFCHNKIHKGCLSGKQLHKHKCLQKKCSFLQKYEEHPYWVERANIKKKKQQRKNELNEFLGDRKIGTG